MKYLKVFVVSIVLVLAACSNKVNNGDIDSYIAKMKEYAETGSSNKESYIEELEEFNEFLSKIEDESYAEYVKLQLEANNMRIEGLKTNNADLISESSWKQAQALEVLEASD